MSDELRNLMRSALASYEAVGVSGSEGARAMREGLAEIERLQEELREAREVMRPFADFYATALTGFTPTWEERQGPDHIVCGWNDSYLRLADLIAVRAFLAKSQ